MIFALKWLIPYWRRYRWRMMTIILLGMSSAALGAVYPYLIKQVINGLGSQMSRAYLMRSIWLILGVGLANSAVSIAAQRNRAYMNMKLEWDFRKEVFEHILRMDSHFFHRFTTGDLVTRLVDDISRKISWFSCSGVFRFIQAVFTLIAAVTMMFLLNPALAVWVLLPTPFMLAASLLTGRKLHERSDALQKSITLIYDFLETCFTGIKLIKANAKEAAQCAFFAAKAEGQMEAEVSSSRLDIIFSYFYHSASFVSVALLYLAGGLMVIDGKATLGDLIAFYFYAGMIMGPLMDISQFFVTGNRAGASIKRIDELLRSGSAVKKPRKPAPAPERIEKVEARDVCMATAKDEPLLRKITFEARRGQLVAVVGKIGSGKTTLISLLTRLAEFTTGELMVNGADIRSFAPDELRRRVGLVTQEPFIMTDTVKNNITLGREGLDGEPLEAALRVSQLKHDLARLPKGLETGVGTRGFTLSGGQKQRVSIARAILAKPDLIIFDDATSAMDAQTEENFWKAFRGELPDAICLIVTHRVKTIEHADFILTMDEGRLAEKGTHAELMALNGLYRQIYERRKLEEELGGGEPKKRNEN
ncbi:MAG: ABC transporter ATP-binding protein [Elusimicrobia bacterium]|nr:ABC transporter ATP-binding protein [Elusimicrobiota bacterium]